MGTPSPISNHYLVLFDGVCNLCNASVQFIIKRDRGARFRFAALQSPYAKEILSKHGISLKEDELFSILLIADNRVHSRSDAALKIARHLSGMWPVLSWLRILPRFLRDPFYVLIARNRYRLFGKKDACMLPSSELKARFVE